MHEYEKPKSMEELLYFTNRNLDGSGKIIAWVRKPECPKCRKARLGKPRDKSGKIKIRAKEYVCPACGFTTSQLELEKNAFVEINYDCPSCGNKASEKQPYKWKKALVLDEETGKKKAVDQVSFNCNKCDAKLVIIRKMK